MDNLKKVFAGMFLLIVAFLLVKDGTRTSTVIQSLGGGLREVTTSLQGGA